MRKLSICMLAMGTLVAQSSAIAAPKHMQFLNKSVGVVTDVGAKGDSPGDFQTFTSTILDMDGKKEVGSGRGFCFLVEPDKHAWECTFTVALPGGVISVEGAFFEQGSSEFIVTGGSGVYVGAKGTLRTHFTDDPKHEIELFVFDLI